MCRISSASAPSTEHLAFLSTTADVSDECKNALQLNICFRGLLRMITATEATCLLKDYNRHLLNSHDFSNHVHNEHECYFSRDTWTEFIEYQIGRNLKDYLVRHLSKYGLNKMAQNCV